MKFVTLKQELYIAYNLSLDYFIYKHERKHNYIRKITPSLAALNSFFFFTFAISFLIYTLYKTNWQDNNLVYLGHDLKGFIYLVAFGIAFSFHQSVYIDLKKSKFRSTFEVGPIKLGQWKTITNYEYVSIFHQPLADGEKIFEVNLWYDKNKHWELYEKHDFKEAFLIAFEIAELLNIDLLDATTPNNFKWIDKQQSKDKKEMIYQ